MSIADNTRWVEAMEIFHQLYVPSGPYKSNVPRLVKEIVARLEGGKEMKHTLLSELGRRGGSRTRLSSSSQLELFPGGTRS